MKRTLSRHWRMNANIGNQNDKTEKELEFDWATSISNQMHTNLLFSLNSFKWFTLFRSLFLILFIFFSFKSVRWYFIVIVVVFVVFFSFFIFHLRSFWALLLNCVRRLVRCLWYATATFACSCCCCMLRSCTFQCSMCVLVIHHAHALYHDVLLFSFTMPLYSLSFYFRWNRLRACVRAPMLLAMCWIMCVGERENRLWNMKRERITLATAITCVDGDVWVSGNPKKNLISCFRLSSISRVFATNTMNCPSFNQWIDWVMFLLKIQSNDHRRISIALAMEANAN